MAKINKAMTLFLLLLSDNRFKSFWEYLRDEMNAPDKCLKKYASLRAEYKKKANPQGVVEIPLEKIYPELFRCLTGSECENCADAAQDIRMGETGSFLGGQAYVHPLAHLPRISLSKRWVVKHPLTGVQVVRAGKVEFPEEPGEIDHCTQIAQETTPEVVVAAELTRIWNGPLNYTEKGNQERILEQVLSRLEGLGMGVGWIVTTKTEVKDKSGKDKGKGKGKGKDKFGKDKSDKDKSDKVHWLKVAAVLPFSAETLNLVPQVAADMLAKLAWMGLDKTMVNVSVRFGTPDGIWKKDHTLGLREVEALERGARFAKHFRDKKSEKACSWRIAQVSLPKSSSEDPDLAEFHAAVAVRNASVQPALDPIVEEVAPVKEVPKWFEESWANDDDDDDDDLVMPTLLSRQEPATPEKEPEPITPVAPKKKNRRGTRGGGRSC